MSRPQTADTLNITLADVTRTLARHMSLYRWRRPTYQTALLKSLGSLWQPDHRSVLDVGGGTGIMAQSIKELFAVDRVVSVDVEDRFLDCLDIETRTYDGRTLPFADDCFDCVMLCNVLHHVPRAMRTSLLKECGRVAKTGAIYIKDHLAESPLDHLQLRILDVLGNVPFGGMVEASYLGMADWRRLAEAAGFRIAAQQGERYRDGLMAGVFPNRLEVVMKWVCAMRA
jgi:ubiquinone/menaquinone biosynthesis C-methylase UbiE